MERVRREWLLLATTTFAVFALLAAFTWGEGGPSWNYLLSVFLIVEIYALFSLGLSLEFGFTGLLNFGHVAFMAIGAYTVAILSERLQGLTPPFSTRLEGASLPGALVVLVLSLLCGALVLVPTLAALQRWARRLPPRFALRIGVAAGALATVLVFATSFPLSAGGARAALVCLLVLAGMAVAAGAGLILGLPTVRLREDYLAIVTIGAAEILRSALTNEAWLTHGTLGIRGLERPVVDWAIQTGAWNSLAERLDVLPVTLAHAFVLLAILAFAYFVLEILARSPWGRVLRAIREDEEVVAALGRNVLRYKLQSLMIGSAIAALAGVFLAWHLSNVYPDHFPSLITFYAFIMVVVGGMGNHRGALAGAVLLWGVFEAGRNVTLLREFGWELAGPPQAILIGLLLIVFVLFRPQGLLGNAEELRHAR